MFMAIYLHKEHKRRINDFVHDLDLFHWLNILKKFEVCGSRRCPISTVREPCRWLKAHLQERIILAGPVWAACENAYTHVGLKKPLETEKLTNEIKNLNHENVKYEELTVMLQTAH
jgi:hypothetical protein